MIDPADGVAERAAAIRAQLPDQAAAEELKNRREIAAALYGPLYSLAELRDRAARTMPLPRAIPPWGRRGVVLEQVPTYRSRIPDQPLLKYDEALQSSLFSGFWVATPICNRRAGPHRWIIAEVADTTRWAVIAHWTE